MKCNMCKYWKISKCQKEAHPDDMRGQCKRFPPVLNIGFIFTQYAVYDALEFPTEASPSYWQHPITEGGNVCGEFKDADTNQQERK